MAIALLGIATLALAHVGSLTIERRADVEAEDGTVVHVTGLAQCTAGEDANIFVNIIQSQGRLFNNGSGSSTFVCDGTVQAWGVLVSSAIGSYQNGPASAIATLSTFGSDDSDDGHEFDSQQVSRTIQLHK